MLRRVYIGRDMKRRILLIFYVVAFLSGCVTTNKAVVDNVFISENNPKAFLEVSRDYKYIGEVSFSEREDNLHWKKKSYVFVNDIGNNNVVERVLHFQTNKINTRFVNNLFGNSKQHVTNTFIQINGKMCPDYIQAVIPANGSYVTDYLYNNGYVLTPAILAKAVIVPIHKDFLFSVVYSEDVSYLGYSVEDWNDGQLDDTQRDFLADFNKRFAELVDVYSINK